MQKSCVRKNNHPRSDNLYERVLAISLSYGYSGIAGFDPLRSLFEKKGAIYGVDGTNHILRIQLLQVGKAFNLVPSPKEVDNMTLAILLILLFMAGMMLYFWRRYKKLEDKVVYDSLVNGIFMAKVAYDMDRVMEKTNIPHEQPDNEYMDIVKKAVEK